MRPRSLAALALAVVLLPTAARSQDKAGGAPAATSSTPGMSFVLEGGIEFGGAKLIELTFTDGSTQSLTAGQGGTIAAGLQYRPAAAPRLSVSGTVGYKFVTNASSNASIGITRVPLELVGRWTLNDDWWAGAGVVKHASVKVEGDGFIPDAAFEASVGPTLELGWRWVALTYTSMEYTAPGGQTFDAGSIGVMVRWVRGSSK